MTNGQVLDHAEATYVDLSNVAAVLMSASWAAVIEVDPAFHVDVLPNSASSRFVQPAKALAPIDFTVDDMMTCLRFVQPL